jgi:hypothetical protein
LPGRVREDIARPIGTVPEVLTRKDAAALRAIGIDLEAVPAGIEWSLAPDALAPRTAHREGARAAPRR